MKTERGKICFLAALFFVLFLVLNFLTPLIVDDYGFIYVVDGSRKITTLSEIGEYGIYNYKYHTGRVLLHAIAQVFLIFDKAVFNVCNSIVFVAVTLLLYRMVMPLNRHSATAYFACVAGIWIFFPVFGQTCLWLIGSCNYLWGAFFIFCFCLPYCDLAKGRQTFAPLFPVGIFILGCLAGACNENSSGGALLFAAFAAAITKFQKRKIPLWVWSGLAGGAIGLAFMALAPGNRNRQSESISTELGSWLFTRVAMLAYATVNYAQLWLPLIVTILLLVWFWQKGFRQELMLPALSLFCSVAVNFVTVLATNFPIRAMLGATAFLLVACGQVLCLVDWRAFQKNRIILAGVILFGLYTSCLYGTAVIDMMASNVVRADREAQAAAIVESRPEGKRCLECPEIRPLTTYNPCYGLEDIFVFDRHWTNSIYAAEYGLDSIKMNGNAYRTWGQALILILKGEYRNE